MKVKNNIFMYNYVIGSGSGGMHLITACVVGVVVVVVFVIIIVHCLFRRKRRAARKKRDPVPVSLKSHLTPKINVQHIEREIIYMAT